MMVPEWVSIFTEENKDSFDYYQVGAGLVNSHQIDVDETQLLIAYNHAQPGTQDLSLRCWFSHFPADTALFAGELWERVTMTRIPTEIVIDGHLPPGRYFFNVQNLVNSPNSYQLIIKNP
jgi:hypothetical protein